MKVLKDFYCSVSGESYKAGDDYKGDRLKELQTIGVVEKPKAKPRKKSK